jgi:hypothetical protein
MNKKSENADNATTPATATVNVKELAAKAASVQEFTDVWIGTSPAALGIDKDAEKVAMMNLVDNDIVILGYSKRKGDTGPFVICTFVPVGGSVAKILVTGAAVIVRKLDEVAEKNGFPVSGKIIRNASAKVKGGHYFDFR